MPALNGQAGARIVQLRCVRGLLLFGILLVGVGCGSSQTGSSPTAASPTSASPTPASRTSPLRALTPRAHSPPEPRRPARAPLSPGRSSQSLQPPQIIWDPIPFGTVRTAQTVAYVHRHYGSFIRPTWRLIDPHVIVIHYTDSSYGSADNTFASDAPDSELHELPSTCAHFVVDQDGTIHQLVSVGTICRHTVGLNWTALGIEQVGYSDGQVLSDRRQITSSLRLVRWLRCRFHIALGDVIGHNESLSNPYHHEDVAALRAQTHADFNHADMQVYRARLRRLGGC